MKSSLYPEYQNIKFLTGIWLSYASGTKKFLSRNTLETVTNMKQKRATFVRKVTIRGVCEELSFFRFLIGAST